MRYQWIIDRVKSGNVVEISEKRRDVNDIVDFILSLPPQTPNWLIKSCATGFKISQIDHDEPND